METRYVFDKDGTITPPNKAIEKKHIPVFASFIEKHKTTLLTARDLQTCLEHIVYPLTEFSSDINLQNLSFACSNGAQIYVFKNNTYKKMSTDSNALGNRDKIETDLDSTYKEALRITREVFPEASIEIRWDFFAALPCIPRNSSTQKRNSLDPNATKRREITLSLKKIFPDFFEILPGGKTSIDIAVINKEYGMRHIIGYFQVQNPSDVHYFWDSFEGGNDEPVKNIQGIHIHEVGNPDDTFWYLKTL